MTQSRARTPVFLFVVLVLSISWAYEAALIVSGGVARFGIAGLVVLMWLPGLVSIAVRLVLRLGFGDVGFAVGKPRYYLLAVVVPLLLALATGALCALLDIRAFAPIDADGLRRIAPVLLPMLAVGLFGAFGEELGWRGFLLPRMIAAGLPHPYLLSGLVWAAWHLPLIAFGDFYATDRIWLMTAAYAASIVAIGFVASALRLRSGSVWVATVLHASHNFLFQLAVPALLFTQPGTHAGLWDIVGSDSGLIVALLYALTVVVLFRRRSGAGG
jgi:membrane protease YdiL (CAAX protease family)